MEGLRPNFACPPRAASQLAMVADMFHAAKIEKEAYAPKLYLLHGVFFLPYARLVSIVDLVGALLFLCVGLEDCSVAPIRHFRREVVVFLVTDGVDGSVSVARRFHLRFHHFHKSGFESTQ